MHTGSLRRALVIVAVAAVALLGGAEDARASCALVQPPAFLSGVRALDGEAEVPTNVVIVGAAPDGTTVVATPAGGGPSVSYRPVDGGVGGFALLAADSALDARTQYDLFCLQGGEESPANACGSFTTGAGPDDDAPDAPTVLSLDARRVVNPLHLGECPEEDGATIVEVDVAPGPADVAAVELRRSVDGGDETTVAIELIGSDTKEIALFDRNGLRDATYSVAFLDAAGHPSDEAPAQSTGGCAGLAPVRADAGPTVAVVAMLLVVRCRRRRWS